MSVDVGSKELLLTDSDTEFSVLIGTQNLSSHIDPSYHYFVWQGPGLLITIFITQELVI